MDGILEHVVQEVRVRLYEVVQGLQLLNLTALLVEEKVKINFETVEFLVFHLLLEVGLLLLDFAVPLLQFLLFFLQRADLFIDLLLHHLVEILLLNVKLFHDAAEGFL